MWAERRLAIFFGCLGLVPFFAGAVGVWWWPQQMAAITNVYFLFSAGVLAFMAGVYWPVFMQLDHCTYPVSPMTAILLSQVFFLLAGVALLIPVVYRPWLFILLYCLLYGTDRTLLRGFWPDWYLKLRLMLTLAVVTTQLAVGYMIWQ